MEGNGAVIEGVDDATAGTGSFGSGGTGIGKGVGKCWSDLEWTRVAEDLTDCLVVFRISISIVSQTLLISMPRYGCNLVIRNPCLLQLIDSCLPNTVVGELLVCEVQLGHFLHVSVNHVHPNQLWDRS